MSANSYITSVPLFQGAQGSYYLVNGYKYHPCFPIHWAMNHKSFRHGEYDVETGPEKCGNCRNYGSIRGVFVGYCSNCLKDYLDAGIWRGVVVVRGQGASGLQNLTLWMQYPYMYGIDMDEIGDKPTESQNEYDSNDDLSDSDKSV